MHISFTELNITIAFVVATTAVSLTAVNERLPYTETIINEGGAYNISSLEFTCPLTGYYYFSFSHLSTKAKALWSLYMDGTQLVSKYSWNNMI